MSDGLNQIGKAIRGQRNDSNDALNRYSRTRKQIERVRDVFDVEVPFNMEFNTKGKFSTVSMNLYFSPPPPSSCCSNNFCSVCEVFADGDTHIVLERGYIENSVVVFIRGIKRSTFTQTDPAGGIIDLTTSVAVDDIVRVCYVYEYEVV